MKICEFFRQQYLKVMPGYDSRINKDIKRGSFQYFQVASEWFFGGSFQQAFERQGITYKQLLEAKAQGYIGEREFNDWESRQRGLTHYWYLTQKGLKALYNTYPDW